MFRLSTLETNVRVPPSELQRPIADAVTEIIEQNFLDKVVEGLGLAITLYDVLDIKGGVIYPRDGAAHYQVTFRLVFFLPSVGEVLRGKVSHSDSEGVRVSMTFFEDAVVPKKDMQEPSVFNTESGLWGWAVPDDDRTLDINVGEEVLVRVMDVRFCKPPTPAEIREGGTEGTAAKPFAPLQLLCSMNGDGLGPLGWWQGAEWAPDLVPQEEPAPTNGASLPNGHWAGPSNGKDDITNADMERYANIMTLLSHTLALLGRNF